MFVSKLSSRLRFLGGTALAAFGASLAAEAVAQALPMEEIVVTARKRTETLQDIPLAITAFSRDQLVDTGAVNLVDIASFTPGIEFQEQSFIEPGRYFQGVRFRGIANDIRQPSQQVGSVFIDGIYLPEGLSSVGTENVERVEIVRGPSSAFFGRSTFSGAVNFVTRRPGEEFAGRISAQLATFGSYDLSASIEGPIVEDVVAGRIYLRGYGTNGQYESSFDGGALGRERTETIMGTLSFTPTEQLDILLRGIYIADNDGPPSGMFLGGPNSRHGDGPSFTTCFDRRPELVGVVQADYFCGAVPVVNADVWTDMNTTVPEVALEEHFRADSAAGTFAGTRFEKPDDIPGVDGMGLKREQILLSAVAEYEFDDGFMNGGEAFASFAYNEVYHNWIRDLDLTSANHFYSQDLGRYEIFTVEGRIVSPQDQRFTWLLGVNYFDAEFLGQFAGGVTAIFNENEPIFGFPPPVYVYSGTPTETGKTLGIFGAAGYQITDQIALDLEMRWQRDRVGVGVPNPQFQDNSQQDQFSSTFSTWLPRVTLQYQPTDITNLWATFSIGNLPGQFNSGVAQLTPGERQQAEDQVGQALLFVDEEKLTNYEIGWRQTWFDGRANTSLVGYFMEWDNIKLSTPVVITREDTGLPGTIVLNTNLASAEILGLEFEGSFAVTENLTLQGTVTWNDSEYTEFTCSGFTRVFALPEDLDCAGNRPPRFPEWNAAFATTWAAPVNDQWSYFIRFDGVYTGKRFIDQANYGFLDDFWRFNTRIGFEREQGDALRLELFVINLFNNDDYLAGQGVVDFSTPGFGFNANQGVVLTPPEKRTVGARVIYDF